MYVESLSMRLTPSAQGRHAAIALAACLVAGSCASGSPGSDTRATSPASASPKVTISPGYPAPDDPEGEIVEMFGDHPDGVIVDGKRFTLWVSIFPDRDPRCRTNFLGRFAAYLSACRRDGRNLSYFYAGLGNDTPTSKGMRLDRFVLVGQDGSEVRPRFIGGLLEDAGDAMPRTRLVDRGEEASGYLAFETPRRFIPARLSYQDGDQKLTVLFPGDHRSVGPS